MGILGTPGLTRWSPVGHHVMAFIPILYLSKVCKNEIKVLYVCTLFLLLQKLLIKAGISWLDCFVKRTNDHQAEVIPSLTANEESDLGEAKKTSGRHSNESYKSLKRNQHELHTATPMGTACGPRAAALPTVFPESAGALLIHQQGCARTLVA